MLKNLLLALVFLFTDSINVYPTITLTPITLGDTTLLLQKESYGHQKLFVHVHQNEKTALEAARKVAKNIHGEILTLKHAGHRNIVFYHNNKTYIFDPNRIFSDKGAIDSLELYSQSDAWALAQIKRFRKVILDNIKYNKIIAVHNNHDYSLEEYYKDHALYGYAKLINTSNSKFYRNFFLVTQDKDYFRLKKLNYNLVLQNKNIADDGSLSILWKNKAYINVEAGYNELAAQIKMLEVS